MIQRVLYLNLTTPRLQYFPWGCGKLQFAYGLTSFVLARPSSSEDFGSVQWESIALVLSEDVCAASRHISDLSITQASIDVVAFKSEQTHMIGHNVGLGSCSPRYPFTRGIHLIT